MMPTLISLAAYAVISLIAFVMYFADKKKAQKNKWRIKEATLLGFGFFGGAIGALLAMKIFRHKTKHWYFWAVNIIGLIWQIALAVFLFIKF
ncbi:MAG: DUF1294 domain-containing protein [Ruminococcus sp.]|nr:DUF1294 domain-containing protein [Ruminococcus sp.]